MRPNTAAILTLTLAKPRVLAKHSKVFIQFFNDRMLTYYGARQRLSIEDISRIQRRAFFAALLLAEDGILIPQIDLTESPYLPLLLREIIVSAREGVCQFVGSGLDVASFLRHKHHHFRDVELYPQYREGDVAWLLNETVKFWTPRFFNTTDEIAQRWKEALESDQKDRMASRLVRSMLSSDHGGARRRLYADLYRVPDRLQGRALLWDVVQQLGIIPNSSEPRLANSARHLLGLSWLESHMDEYGASILWNLGPLGGLDDGASRSRPGHCLDFGRITALFRMIGINDALSRLDIEQLLEVRTWPAFDLLRRVTLLPELDPTAGGDPISRSWIRGQIAQKGRQFIEELKRADRTSTQTFSQLNQYLEFLTSILEPWILTGTHTAVRSSTLGRSNAEMKPRIFIIHGWAHDTRNRLERFLEKELGVEAVLMEFDAMGGRTLAEKFEDVSDRIDYAIALVTADEKIIKPNGESTFRIRPNILVEIGYFWGRLGRSKVGIFLEEGQGIEIPTDLSGVGYQQISSDFDGLKYRVRKELERAALLPISKQS